MKGLLTLLCCICLATVAAGQTIVINEVVYDSEGTDTDTWLELLGPPGTLLDGFRLIGINGNGGAEYNEILLDGLVIPDDGYFLITEDPNRPDSDYSTSLVDYQNGSDSIQLQVQGEVPVWVIVDAVGYGAFDGGEVFAGEGTPAPDQIVPYSLARCPDGNDTDDNGADFILDPDPTPGYANAGNCSPALGACCFIDGTCLELTQIDCTDAGGEYLGDDTVCDPNPCSTQEPTDYTLCELAEDDPATGRPLHEGEWVRVTGVALMESWVWADYRTEFTITDGDCCINIYWSNNTDPLVVRGDEVEVVGTLGFYNGKTQITTPDISITILSQGNPIPDPTPITTFELSVNGEAYESCLIKLTCVTIVDGTWPPEGQNANLTVDDGSGPTTLRIDKDTNIDGSPPPTGPFSAVGIGGQYDTSEPYFDGYQSIMRDLDDVLLEDCGPVTGACCFADGTCQVLLEEECTASGGDLWLPGEDCEPNPCEPEVPTDYTLCEIAEDDPATGRPLHEGEWVRVTGLSLMESYVWADYRTEFAITDESGCCIHVYASSATDPPIVRGDEVEVIGTVGFYNGKTQITTPDLSIVVLSQGNPIPDPTPVSTFDLSVNGESYEGCLIKLTCVTIVGGDPWPPEGDNANLEVDDGSGPVTLRIDKDTNIDGSPPPEGEFSAIGIGGQYDYSEPYFDGYQCVMRDLDDVLYDDCLPPYGACCFEDGTCEVLFEDECTQVGGDQWIEGEVCDPNPCPQPPPLGACCLLDGTCQVMEEDACYAADGFLWLPDETCDPDPCPPVAVEETSWGRIKANYR